MRGFSAKYYQISPMEYRESFLAGIRSGRINKEMLRKELDLLLSRGDNLFKDLAKEYEVFFYDNMMTEEDARIIFQLLTWDVIFPEKILPDPLLQKLKTTIVSILENEEKSNNRKSVHVDDIIWQLEEEAEWSDLSRFDLLYMQREIGYPEIQIEYYIPELWFLKLSDAYIISAS